MTNGTAKFARSAGAHYKLEARIAALGGILFLDKILLNHFVDFARAQSAQGLGAFLRAAQHFGFRFVVTFGLALAVFAYVRGGAALRQAASALREARVRPRWLAAHALLVAALMPLSALLFPAGPRPVGLALVAASWILIALMAVGCALLAIASAALWRALARALGPIWVYAFLGALAATGAMQLSEALWRPTAGVTFELVRLLLAPFMPSLIADPATRVLTASHFAVQIADVCSGLEGMGLTLAFTTAWLVYFRREYVFPRALILIPVGLAAIFALNVLRIAVLMLIGNAGYPDVAVYGFHSQAGWIAFNAVACAIALLSRRSRWLGGGVRKSIDAGGAHNPTAVYLVPLLAILAAGILSRAMSGRFEWFYPLRLAAACGALWFWRKELLALRWRGSWRGILAGAAVFAAWVGAARFALPPAGMPMPLAQAAPALRWSWVLSRAAAAVLTVPLAEELAFRGFLMRRLMSADFESIPYRRVRVLALCAAAGVFAALHGAMWAPAALAGLVYGALAVRRDSLGEAVVAHATTNGLIVAAVLGWGAWRLW